MGGGCGGLVTVVGVWGDGGGLFCIEEGYRRLWCCGGLWDIAEVGMKSTGTSINTN